MYDVVYSILMTSIVGFISHTHLYTCTRPLVHAHSYTPTCPLVYGARTEEDLNTVGGHSTGNAF